MTIHRNPELPDGEAWDRYVEWLGRRTFAGGNVDREHYFQSAEREIAIFREMGIAFSGRSALEFGCGDGRLLCNLIGRFPELTGVDASKARRAREIFSSGKIFVSRSPSPPTTSDFAPTKY